MKKFSKYYLILVFIVMPISFLLFFMYKYIGQNILNVIIPLFLLISVSLVISSFFFLIKKDKISFKYIINKAIFSLLIIIVSWFFVGLFQTTYSGPSSNLTAEQIPGPKF